MKTLTCCLCDRVALRVVGAKGFCGDHKSQAFEAQAKAGNAPTGRGWIIFDPQGER